MRIEIIDYGAGNLRSVAKAIEHLGYNASMTKDPSKLKKASGIILPGVGAFDSAIEELEKLGFVDEIKNIVKSGKPLLGICLGYQMFFDSSEEGNLKELSLFNGSVKKFNFADLKEPLAIPHMGWNSLKFAKKSPLFNGVEENSMVYFAHSYYCAPVDSSIVSTKTDYGFEFASSVSADNVFGIQFHPEKSSSVGLKILENFCKLCLK